MTHEERMSFFEFEYKPYSGGDTVTDPNEARILYYPLNPTHGAAADPLTQNWKRKTIHGGEIDKVQEVNSMIRVGGQCSKLVLLIDSN
jgi:hypothetical protein